MRLHLLLVPLVVSSACTSGAPSVASAPDAGVPHRPAAAAQAASAVEAAPAAVPPTPETAEARLARRQEFLLQRGAIARPKKATKKGLFRDEGYFVSSTCADFKCGFVERLRDPNFTYHFNGSRPGGSICKALGGTRGDRTAPGFEEGDDYCVFPEDDTFASFNLLESWDGKKFGGPAPSIPF